MKDMMLASLYYPTINIFGSLFLDIEHQKYVVSVAILSPQ